MAHIGVPDKGEEIEGAHPKQIRRAQGDALLLTHQEGGDQEFSPKGQQQGEQYADPHHDGSAPEEAVEGPAVFSGSLVLGHKDGDGLTAAAAEGLAEVFNAGGGSEGGDGRCADAVDRALDHQLAQIEAGLLQSGHSAVADGLPHQKSVHAHVTAPENQEGLLFPNINQAKQGGEQLGTGGGQGGPLDAQVQQGHQYPGRGQIVYQGDQQEEQGRLGVADGPEGRGQIIIGEGKNHSTQDDPQVVGHIAHQVVGGLDKLEEGI